MLLLDDAHRGVLAAFDSKRLFDVTDRLEKEKEIRKRLLGKKEKPTLLGAAAEVAIEGEGLSGRVGVPVHRDAQLTLSLLRDGVYIERTTLGASFGLAWAAVDCPAFNVDADWEKVVRDDVFARALRAVREAEGRLPLAILAMARKHQKVLSELPPGCAAYLVAFLKREADFRAGAVPGQILSQVLDARLISTSMSRGSGRPPGPCPNPPRRPPLPKPS